MYNNILFLLLSFIHDISVVHISISVCISARARVCVYIRHYMKTYIEERNNEVNVLLLAASRTSKSEL